MNDDYLFLRPVKPWHFFLPEGGVRLFMGADVVTWTTAQLNVTRRLTRAHWRGATSRSWDVAEAKLGPLPRYILKHSPFIYHLAAFPLIRKLWPEAVAETLRHPFRNYMDVITPILHHSVVLKYGDAEGLPGRVLDFVNLHKSHRYLPYRAVAAQLAEALKDIDGDPNVVFLTVNGKCSEAASRDLFLGWLARRYPTPSSFELPGS